MEHIPRATRAILIANGLIYLLELLLGPVFFERFALWPLGAGFEPWQLLTYGFLHDPSNAAHILFNMLAVFMFGSRLEHFFGTRSYVLLYFASVLAAAATQLLVSYVAGWDYPIWGASGGVFGLLLAFAVYFPREQLMLVFPPIPVRAWLLVSGYAALELILALTQAQAQIAHVAHLGGLLGAALVILYWRL